MGKVKGKIKKILVEVGSRSLQRTLFDPKETLRFFSYSNIGEFEKKILPKIDLASLYYFNKEFMRKDIIVIAATAPLDGAFLLNGFKKGLGKETPYFLIADFAANFGVSNFESIISSALRGVDEVKTLDHYNLFKYITDDETTREENIEMISGSIAKYSRMTVEEEEKIFLNDTKELVYLGFLMAERLEPYVEKLNKLKKKINIAIGDDILCSGFTYERVSNALSLSLKILSRKGRRKEGNYDSYISFVKLPTHLCPVSFLKYKVVVQHPDLGDIETVTTLRFTLNNRDVLKCVKRWADGNLMKTYRLLSTREKEAVFYLDMVGRRLAKSYLQNHAKINTF